MGDAVASARMERTSKCSEPRSGTQISMRVGVVRAFDSDPVQFPAMRRVLLRESPGDSNADDCLEWSLKWTVVSEQAPVWKVDRRSVDRACGPQVATRGAGRNAMYETVDVKHGSEQVVAEVQTIRFLPRLEEVGNRGETDAKAYAGGRFRQKN